MARWPRAEQEKCEQEEDKKHAFRQQSCALTFRLTAPRRPRGETKLLYPDHRPSTDPSDLAGAAGAVEPVVRRAIPPPDTPCEA